MFRILELVGHDVFWIAGDPERRNYGTLDEAQTRLQVLLEQVKPYDATRDYDADRPGADGCYDR